MNPLKPAPDPVALTPSAPTGSVALVHDYLLVMRGAERTFAAMSDLWPRAPIYTLLYDQAGTKQRFGGHRVNTSFLQATGADQSSFRRLLPLFPVAVTQLRVSDFPVVVSSSSAFAHGVRPAPGAAHICYCHTPFRYAWFERERAAREVSPPLRPALTTALGAIRRWDRKASGRVTHYIANSRHTQRRIQEIYGRDSSIIPPPVDVHRFRSAEPEDYFLVVSEIVAHKRIEAAAAAATAARQRLKVVGSGPELERLRARYPQYVEFLGRVDDAALSSLYSRARAVIVPNVEEFGIAAVEAMAAGRPVIAARAGGALETVVEGMTGRFFGVDDVPELTRTLREFDNDDFDRNATVRRAHGFSTETFQQRLSDEISRAVVAGAKAPAG